MKTLSLTEARNNLLRLAEEIERDPSVVVEVRVPGGTGRAGTARAGERNHAARPHPRGGRSRT